MLQGKTILVTGATNGIGEITAHSLAQSGASVVIVSRSEARCKEVTQRITSETGNANVSYIAGDLSTLKGINAVADAFLKTHTRLDVLLNNAGALFTKREVSADGFEMTFALNHLSYFLLTQRLLGVLKDTATAHGEARIVNVSSGAHLGVRNGIAFDDIQRKKSYSYFGVYSESKLMNVMFTYAQARRLENTGVTVNALHPGFVKTNFGRSNGGFFAMVMGFVQQLGAITPEKGAETSIYLASSPQVKGVTGKYFVEKAEKASSSVSHDKAQQERLWTLSEELSGLPITV